jgi:hypothetical protein
MKKRVDAAQAAQEKKVTAAPAGPTPVEVKQVIGQILQEFINEEAGNKVTRNNIAGLTIQLHGAIDGHITIKQQEGNTP